MEANPDLQAAAERFVQARDVMMKARSQYLPRLGLGFDASDNRQSDRQTLSSCRISHPRRHCITLEALHLGSQISGRRSAMPHGPRPIAPKNVPPTMGSRASACRRKLRRTISRSAASTHRMRSIPNRLSSTKDTLELTKSQFAGAIASALDVARVESSAVQHGDKISPDSRSTPSDGTGDRHPSQYGAGSFTIEPVDELRVANFTIPRHSLPPCLSAGPTSPQGSDEWRRRTAPSVSPAPHFFPMCHSGLGGGFEDAASI